MTLMSLDMTVMSHGLNIHALTCLYRVLENNFCNHYLSSDAQSDGQKMPSFNGELNGLLGTAGLLGSTDWSMSESSRPISTDMSTAQDTQIM